MPVFRQPRTDRLSFALSIVTLGFAVGMSHEAAGQAADAAAARVDSAAAVPDSGAREAARVMEEVFVTGQRPIGALIREGAQLTEDFYARLNEVLNDDDFRITCDDARRTASNIATRICRTGYQRRLESQEAGAALRDLAAMQQSQQALGESGSIQPIAIDPSYWSQALQWQSAFDAAVLHAVNTDPILNDQVIRLLALRSAVENYQSPRQRRREERRAARAAERAADAEN